jgi:hypothetical protein
VYDDVYDAVRAGHGVVEGDEGYLLDVVYMLVHPPRMIGLNLGIADNYTFHNMDYRNSCFILLLSFLSLT